MNNQDLRAVKKGLKGLSLQDKTCLVTGGCGFIGSWLCHFLVSDGADVICVDNLSSGLEENISSLRDRENFTYIHHDITTPLPLDLPLDYVIHTASRSSPMEFSRYPVEILSSNTLGTLVAIELARKHRAGFLFTSTSEVYGNPVVVPTPETYIGQFNHLGPRGCYDEGKRAGETIALAYSMQFDVDVRIARIFNTFGPRMRSDGIYGRVIPRFIDQAIHNHPITICGDGTQTRSFCYISDLIIGLLRMIQIPECSGKIVNLGNPEERQIIQVASLIKSVTGSQSAFTFWPERPEDPLRRCPEITRARSLLGWEPVMKFEDGIKRMMDDVYKNIHSSIPQKFNY